MRRVLIEVSNSREDQRKSEVLAEYSALRDEILKREDMRQNILTFAVLSAGTIMTLSVNEGFKAPWPLLIYPVLAMLLALAWMQSDLRIGEIGRYIRTRIEYDLEGLNWEAHLSQKHKNTRFRSVEATAIGVFLVSQTLTVVLAMILFHQSREDYGAPLLPLILVIIDGLAMVFTAISLRFRTIKLYRSIGSRKVIDTAGLLLGGVLLVGGIIIAILALSDLFGLGHSLGFEGHPIETGLAIGGVFFTVVGLVLFGLFPRPSA